MDESEDLMVARIPAYLTRYLTSMLATGLYGRSMDDVVVRCVEREAARVVQHKLIAPERFQFNTRWQSETQDAR